jgi:hypothetical protein
LSYPKMDLSIISIRPPAEEGQGEGSEKKWTEARDWVSRKLAKSSNRKYRPSEKQKPDAIVAGANKRLAPRFYQLKTGHCLTGQYLQWTSAPYSPVRPSFGWDGTGRQDPVRLRVRTGRARP